MTCSAPLDRAITAAGYLPRGGQIVDATLVAAPRQRLTDGEKARIKAGRTAAEVWPERPAKARQKDVDARWTLQRSKGKSRPDGTEPTTLAVPLFGYKSHVSIDRMHGLVRRQVVANAARHDGARLREGLIQRANTARDVWADSAHRSAENKEWLAKDGLISRTTARSRAAGRCRSPPVAARARRAAIRTRIEHVFAQQQARMRMTIRTVGPARARAAITLANMAYNMTRWWWLNGRAASA